MKVFFWLNWIHETFGSDPVISSAVRLSQNKFLVPRYIQNYEVWRHKIWYVHCLYSKTIAQNIWVGLDWLFFWFNFSWSRWTKNGLFDICSVAHTWAKLNTRNFGVNRSVRFRTRLAQMNTKIPKILVMRYRYHFSRKMLAPFYLILVS